MRTNLAHLRLDSFCPRFYLALYPDLLHNLRLTPQDAWNHYTAYGLGEGRCPNPFFDPRVYLKLHPDVAAEVGAGHHAGALGHWLCHGLGEGRRGSAVFDLAHYLSTHEDVSHAARGSLAGALEHWLAYGHREQRRTTAAGPHLELVESDHDCFPFVDLGTDHNARFFAAPPAEAGERFRYLDVYPAAARAIQNDPDFTSAVRLSLPAGLLARGHGESPSPSLADALTAVCLPS